MPLQGCSTLVSRETGYDIREFIARDQGGEIRFLFHLKRDSRRYRRLTMLFTPELVLEVRGSQRVLIEHVDTFILKSWHWIEKTKKGLEQKQARHREAVAYEPVEGGAVPFFGRRLTLRTGAAENRVDLETGELQLAVPAEAPQAVLEREIYRFWRREVLLFIRAQVNSFQPTLHVLPAAISLSNAKRQWGACTSRGKIRINWRMVFLPPHLGRYVVAHELSHLVHMNHSGAFWQEVARLDPDMQEHRDELRDWAITMLPYFDTQPG